jgi:flagellar motility protein MotE (MotC chaperone)
MTQSPEANAKQVLGKGTASQAEAKAKENKKRKKGSVVLLILIIIILTTIIALGAIFLFDFAGLKAETSMWLSNIPVVGKLIRPVVENKTPEQIAKEEIELEKKSLTIKQNEINEKLKELEAKEKELERKERELTDQEVVINDTMEKLSEKLKSIEEQVKYLEKIDNAKAVKILMSMEEKGTVVQILRNMPKEKASRILELMDPLQAAQLLEDLAVPENNSYKVQPPSTQ